MQRPKSLPSETLLTWAVSKPRLEITKNNEIYAVPKLINPKGSGPKKWAINTMTIRSVNFTTPVFRILVLIF